MLKPFGEKARAFMANPPEYDPRITILEGAVRSSKAQPLDAKVLTPNGWVQMGDIRVGDLVITQDGTATRVTGVFPQGEKEIFRVSFQDGAATECCGEHLWETWTYAERNAAAGSRSRWEKRRKSARRLPKSAQPKIRTTDEIRETLKAPHLGGLNHSIRIVEPVQFNAKSAPVDPYLLGVLLGDGCFRSTQASIACADKEILDYISTRLPENCEIRYRSGYDYDICSTAKLKHHKRSNALIIALEAAGLWGCFSHEKHIPVGYLFNSKEVRLEVLRGLMDSDGHVPTKTPSSAKFSTTSKRLAEDVRFLVQSLGGISKQSVSIPKFTYNGKQKTGRLCYVLTINLAPGINPFRLSRKANIFKPRKRDVPARYIASVESVGFKQAQCISVEHPSHLYVTDEFIVTHNTWAIMVKIILLCTYKVAGRRVIIGLTRQSIINNVINDLRALVGEKRFKFNHGTGEMTLLGVKWWCCGASDVSSEKKIRGLTVGIAIVDEASLIPENFWNMLLSRMSPEGARLIASTNPDSPRHFLKVKFIDNAQMKASGLLRSIHFQLSDNPNLPEEYKKQIMQSYHGLFYRRFILGEWCTGTGGIYTSCFDDRNLFDETTRPVGLYGPGGYVAHYISVDVGSKNPQVYAEILDDGVVVWVIRLYYWDSTVEERQLTDFEYAQALEKFIRDSPVGRTDDVQIIVDPSALSFRLELVKRGMYVKEANNEVLEGIRMTSTMLGNKTLRFHKDQCKVGIDELTSYSWDDKAAENGVEQPLHANSHFPDSVRYYVRTEINNAWRLSQVAA